jgi:hypothetical protein
MGQGGAVWVLVLAGAGPPRHEASLTLERLSRGTVEKAEGADWGHTVPAAGISLARYWSHHHRTELSVALTGRAALQAVYDVGRPTVHGAFVSHDYRHQLVSLAQVVQLRRNEWLHPQLGLGGTLDVERRRSWLEPLDPQSADGVVFPTEADRERVLSAHPSRTRTVFRPFGMAAVKAYLTPRAFVRAGVRWSPGGGGGWTLQVNAGRDW